MIRNLFELFANLNKYTVICLIVCVSVFACKGKKKADRNSTLEVGIVTPEGKKIFTSEEIKGQNISIDTAEKLVEQITEGFDTKPAQEFQSIKQSLPVEVVENVSQVVAEIFISDLEPASKVSLLSDALLIILENSKDARINLTEIANLEKEIISFADPNTQIIFSKLRKLAEKYPISSANYLKIIHSVLYSELGLTQVEKAGFMDFLGEIAEEVFFEIPSMIPSKDSKEYNAATISLVKNINKIDSANPLAYEIILLSGLEDSRFRAIMTDGLTDKLMSISIEDPRFLNIRDGLKSVEHLIRNGFSEASIKLLNLLEKSLLTTENSKADQLEWKFLVGFITRHPVPLDFSTEDSKIKTNEQILNSLKFIDNLRYLFEKDGTLEPKISTILDGWKLEDENEKLAGFNQNSPNSIVAMEAEQIFLGANVGIHPSNSKGLYSLTELSSGNDILVTESGCFDSSGNNRGTINLDPISGEISITPKSGWIGDCSFKVSFFEGRETTTPLTLSISEPPKYPVITLNYPQTAYADEAKPEFSVAPAQSKNWLVGESIKLYSGANCSGTELGSASIPANPESSILVRFAQPLTTNNQEIQVWGKIFDPAGKPLGCSKSPVTYKYYLYCSDTSLTSNDISEGNGTFDDPFVICNLAQLQKMQENLSAHYELGTDIDASETASWTTGTSGTGFIPIGGCAPTYNCSSASNHIPFTGSFNGNGFTISNLTINRDRDSVGLFGIVKNTAVITNLRLTGLNISQPTKVGTVGGLVGLMSLSSIAEIYVSGLIQGQNQVGGLVGQAINSHITNSSANLTNLTGEHYIGGIVGNASYSDLFGVQTSGTINAESHGGGIVGWGTSYIQRSTSNVTINGSALNFGGLVGKAYQGQIAESSFTGVVNALDANNVGGLIGYVEAYGGDAWVRNNFSSGQVSGAFGVGGSIGKAELDYYGTINIENNLSTANVVGTNNVGGFLGVTDGAGFKNNLSTGTVTSNGGNVKGFIGLDNSSTLENNVWYDSSASDNASECISGAPNPQCLKVSDIAPYYLSTEYETDPAIPA